MLSRPRQRQLTASDGTNLSFFDTGGTSEPVVFLHGLAGSAVEFFPSADSIQGRRSVLVDLRGHGRSTRRPSDLSRAAFVSDVVQIIEEVARSVMLVGQSMGGHTAMLVAASRPDLVSRLLLLESGAGGGTEAEREELSHYFESWPAPFANRDAARHFLGDGALQRAWIEDLDERADGLYPRFDGDVMVDVLRGVADPRWHEWERVICRTTVVYGSEGMFTEEERRSFVDAGSDALMVTLNGAGHDAHLDSPQAWYEVLRAFLSAGPGA